ncbi:tetratricopeptide repeat protein [Pleionea sp. CnH1-48]|uniref:tetratricopeptide repeat protein n=1 Tax=Pleionea sp. CnH1-48 TaxID=2954494 RepID=UPI0020977BF9|nr:tetratricopeptide repeat protein [Pleionea sp. CnH1-48]MCO7226293.1 sel1 repeat family protein [Pleionea sp. CnH1-48]
MRYQWFLLIICLFINSAQGAANSSKHRSGGTSIYFTELGPLRHKAEAGDPNALFLLGNLYLSPPKNTSVRQNLKKAADYYFQAALREHAGAQYNLAVLYYRGSGIKESKMMATVWFRLAANNGSPVAKNIKRNALKALSDIDGKLSSPELEDVALWLGKYQTMIDKKDYRMARLPDL